jgi:hypothetical protein
VNKGGGSYSFTTVVVFENDSVIDNVVGTCDGNALALTRTRPSIDFTQILEGTLTLANGVVTVKGTFKHTTSLDTYTWSGQIVNP